ncbi:tyrosine-protein phosphatase non-receptor type 4 isoform X1 [Phlebotomus argentipes]|uniref:tyrosine-protein phosphatase non-receptor type 4 isoform X1 n=1 Tax=Phlebotomus argentipes TaxID=94469 RepID=UPI00289300D2|nr:tyrosine-protein phosphatase non-receptor type 4 isoform X1 [Phlebotomus argentipes]XP_059613923.1 tyrosine-protein phosphatase non-receptor type 4 isoform X1 [Phlebotomus argentipes]
MFERVGLGSFSSTYKARGELARDKKSRTIAVSVLFLDDTAHTFPLEKRAKGAELLNAVFRHLELSERDYFGLQFAQQPGDVVVRLQLILKTVKSTIAMLYSFFQTWVDPNKSFKKQWQTVRGGDVTPSLYFKVKFFVTDPSRLQEEYTRYQFYLQIKRDILRGKLQCSLNTACLLASYTVQAELGDYNPVEHAPGYLSALQLLADQSEETEKRVCEMHKLHRGQLPADAEYNYLEHAKRLDMYGIDLHSAMDSDRNELQLGVSSTGLIVFQNAIRMNMFSWSKMVKLSFKRKDFFIQLRREIPESYDTLLGFSMKSHRNAKSLWKSCVEHHSFFRLQRPHRSPRFLPLSLGSKFYYSGRTELQAVQESKQRTKVSKIFIRSPSKRILGSPLNGSESNGKSSSSIIKNTRPHDNKVTSKQTTSIPRKAWEQQSDDDGFIEQLARSYDLKQPLYGENGQEEGQVVIRLTADEQGRFGFNVKGGADLKLPVLVSRVAPHTPADKSNPRVREGDQVLMINGYDISALKHDQIVALIRASREYRGGELVLTIKPQAHGDQIEEEPICLYVPESDGVQLEGDALFNQSLLLLSDGLASGALLVQYEQMYRKNPDLAITEARKPENAAKNRYRDISPYDCTRVVLINSTTGDYINANYVNMEIPGGTVNRYIATQGPLSNTTTDFWRMVQQESSHLVVMLTTVMERGRPKCHQYWPVAGDTMDLADGFSIQCKSESADETGSFVFRELYLCDTKTDERRFIQHMQYLAWPDHGVPADPNLFLQFTERVRSARSTTLLQEIEASLRQVRLMDADENGVDICERKSATGIDDDSPDDIPPSTSVHQYISAANPPVIVHCSAGIGRTGVLILMDTALALMEQREPVYPLDIVQTMRDQRACMVQNAGQYRFVCECICAAYAKMATESQQ